MTTKKYEEFAEDLVERFSLLGIGSYDDCIKMALIACDVAKDVCPLDMKFDDYRKQPDDAKIYHPKFWDKLKNQIKQL
jgi:hypothetical protein